MPQMMPLMWFFMFMNSIMLIIIMNSINSLMIFYLKISNEHKFLSTNSPLISLSFN